MSLTEKHRGLLDVEVGGLVLLLQEQTHCRCPAKVEGREAGAGEVFGETRAQDRCQVTVRISLSLWSCYNRLLNLDEDISQKSKTLVWF